MLNFEDWCKHYEYDPTCSEAKDDYQKYSEKLDFFRAQLDKNNEG